MALAVVRMNEDDDKRLTVLWSTYKADPDAVYAEANGREIVIVDDETGAHKMYIARKVEPLEEP